MTAKPDEPYAVLLETIGAAWPVDEWRDVNTLVAVSGGADSVALLVAMHTLKQSAGGAGRLIVGHFNHRLRGEQSEADAAWVTELADRLGVGCEQGEAGKPLADAGEAAFRDARYAFLQQAARHTGARFIATAHTADDQAETLFMRLFRGTGIAGLAGIPSRRPLDEATTLVRPMLDVRRRLVLAALSQIDQPFREDPSNRDPQYTRNRVRHETLPLLRQQFGDEIDNAVLRLAEQAADVQAVVNDAAELVRSQAIVVEESHGTIRLSIDRARLAGCRRLVAVEAVRLAWRGVGWPEQAMGRDAWRRVEQLLFEEVGPAEIDLPGGVHAARRGDRVVLAR